MTEQERRATLRAVCDRAGAGLTGLITHKDVPVDGGRLLYAIAGRESIFGRLREFVRAEPAYQPKGKYFNAQVRAAWDRYGILVSSSYGSFQVLYVVAAELGFNDHPIKLQDDEVCAYWAARLIRQRFIHGQGAKTLRDVADAYNSGGIGGFVPSAYIEAVTAFYEEAL
jgi:hypothetical protein